jgi:hypothetical protein
MGIPLSPSQLLCVLARRPSFEDGNVVVKDKGVSVTQITTDAARRFVRGRREEGTGNAAINRSLAALRRMLGIAKRDKKIHDVPFIEAHQVAVPVCRALLRFFDCNPSSRHPHLWSVCESEGKQSKA